MDLALSTAKGDGYTESSEASDSMYKQSTWRNIMIIISLSMASIHFGYYACIFNSMAVPLFEGHYRMTVQQKDDLEGNVNTLFGLGTLIGASFTGKLSEVFGRRKLVMLYDLLTIIVVAMYYIDSINVLYLTRFLSGYLAVGAYSLSTIVQAEVLPKRLSGNANAFAQLMYNTFVCLSYLQQNILSKESLIKNWRWILCWTIFPQIIKLLMVPFFWPTESPKFYLSKYAKTEDREALRFKMVAMYSVTHTSEEATSAANDSLEVYEKEQESKKQNGSILYLILSSDIRKRFFAGLLLGMSQQFCGQPYFALYSTDLFNRVSGNGKEVTFFIAMSRIAGGILIIIGTRTFGRKISLLTGMGMQFITLGLVLLSLEYRYPVACFISTFAFMCSFSFGVGGTFYVFINEILPPTGVGLSAGILAFINVILVKVIPVTALAFGDPALLIFFWICCFLLFFCIDYLVIETKGKSESRIIEEYKNKPYIMFDFE